jgi:two-component system LytT family response regulator
MNAIIVDDENKACRNLENMLKEYVDIAVNITGVANSTAEAEKLIRAQRPDVVFLDIEMPEEDAFHFLDRISPVEFEIVFVTAYDEFAIKAFRLNAIDYILKPIRVGDLRTAMERLQDRLRYKAIMAQNNSYAEVSNNIINNIKYRSITLRDSETIEIVKFEDIYYIEAQGSYSNFIFLKEGTVKEILSSYPLSYYEELLPEDIFFRIHRSYFLNCKHVRKVFSDTCHVTLPGEISLPVSRRRFPLMVGFLKNVK